MHPRISAFSVAVAALTLVATATAYANGINPPRVRGGSVITASCLERSGQRQHDILRARVASGNQSSELLNVRVGEASEQVPITQIESITFTGTTIDRNGFADASLMRRADSSDEPVAVQVRSAGSAVRLIGFKGSGSTVSVELQKCERIEFSQSSTGIDARPRPVEKK
jgi:hypothetical protein